MKSLAATSCLWSPSPTVAMATFVKASISRSPEPHGAGPLHGGQHARRTLRLDDEDFFLGDAQQVVVVGRAGDDGPGGAVEVGRFVDDDRRIARPGDDGPLAAAAWRLAPRPVRR